MKKVLYYSSLILVLMGIGIVSYTIYKKEHEYEAANESYKEINEQFLIKEESGKNPETVIPDETTKKQLAVDFSFDYEKMLKKNPEVKGYIYLNDSQISYPIVKHSDNDYYLNHDALNNYSVNGAIFIDYEIENDFDAMNCIIYGHHMDNDSMFGDVASFSDKKFAMSHQSFYIYVGSKPYEYRVISTFVCSPTDESVYRKGFSSTSEFVSWAQDLIKRSDHEYEEKVVNENDKIITLSTCTNRGDTRSVAILKQIR